MKLVSAVWILVLGLLAVAPEARAQNPASAAVTWANSVYNDSISFPSSSQVSATGIDAAGNQYVASSIRGAVRIGTQLFIEPDSNEVTTVIKYAPTGSVVWVKRFTATNHGVSRVWDMHVNAAGEIWLTGSFTNSITIGGTTVTASPGQRDYYVMKWNTAGNLVWITQGGGNGFRVPKSITLDGSGNIYLGGYYKNASNFGNMVLTPAFSSNPNSISAFLAKLNSSGTVLNAWTGLNSTANSSSDITSVAVDQAGNIYLDGTFGSGSLVWGNEVLSGGVSNTFWLKLNANAQPLGQLVHEGTFFYNEMKGLAVDAAGNSFRTNNFNISINLGGISFSTAHINNTDGYVAKYDPNGVLQWATHLHGLNQNDRVLSTRLVTDNLGQIYIAGEVQGEALLGSFVAFGQSTHFLAALDGFTGQVLWVRQATGSANIILNPVLAVSQTGLVSWAGNFMNGPLTFDSGVITGTQVIPNTYSFFVARVLQNFNTISGSVFLDANANAQQDSTEGAYPGGTMVNVAPNQQAFHTTASGNYNAVVEQGIFTLTPETPLYHNLVSTGPTSATFTSFGNTSANHNFALQPIANQLDLRVIVTPLLPARPGFTTAYRITYSNPGTVAMPAGTVTLTFDPQFTYLSSTPVGNISATTLTWNYTNLLPGQTRNINVNLSLPTSAVVGNPVTVSAAIFPVADDLTPADNSETNTRPITASYDPNIIEVNHQELALQQVQNGQWLEYTIHFQNQGTDTAFTVMIRDSLQANLYKMSTISLMGASHSCSWSVNSAGVMTILFTNIRLPHQAVNVLGSHGFIRFRIKPQNTLAVGSIIPNRARIYFDYNPAIITNIAETEVVQQVSAEAELPEANWQLFPNPATQTVTVTASLGGFAEVKIRVVNALGQEVYSRKTSTANNQLRQEINLSNLPSGVYAVQLQTPGGTAVKRLVKQ